MSGHRDALVVAHDLRHRRLSVWHMAGVPVAEMARRVGQRKLSVTLDTYSHVVLDRREIDRAAHLRVFHVGG
jgi:hypothetical protein